MNKWLVYVLFDQTFRVYFLKKEEKKGFRKSKESYCRATVKTAEKSSTTLLMTDRLLMTH